MQLIVGIAVPLVALAVVPFVGAVIGLLEAFGAVGGQSIDPSQKATILGEGTAALDWIPDLRAQHPATLGKIVRGS